MPKVSSSDTEEEENEIGSDGELELAERTISMDWNKDDYIYLQGVERADKNRRINTEAKIKNVSTQT